MVTAERALERGKAAWLKQHGGDLTSLVGTNFIGIGCTAAIVSTAPKRGDHRAHVACASDSGRWVYQLKLRKGARSRSEEDGIISRLIVRGLLEASGESLDEQFLAEGLVPEGCTDGEEVVDVKYIVKGDELDSLLSDSQDPDMPCTTLLYVPTPVSPPPAPPGAAAAQSASADMSRVAIHRNYVPQTRVVVYPGSFNPLHDGKVPQNVLLACASVLIIFSPTKQHQAILPWRKVRSMR